MTPFDRVIDALESRELRPRRSGANFSARCPVHDDRSASLSVGEGREGNALLKCHAGCEFRDIVSALGLEESDTFPPKDDHAPGKNGTGRRIVAEYDYRDESDALLYQAIRFEPKDFRQRKPTPAGGWEWSIAGVRRVPFHLPQLLANVHEGETVYVVEGEKDVLNLEAHGFCATCNAMGADEGNGSKFPRDFATYFTGARVVILPDNDAPGRKHAAHVSKLLTATAKSVRVVELEGLPEHGDVSDWFAQGHTAEELDALVSATSQPAPGAAPPLETPENPAPVSYLLSDYLKLPRPARSWIVPGLLPVGGLAVLSSDAYIGKSTLLAQLVIAIAAGRPFLGFEVSAPVVTMFWQAEGNPDLFAERIACAAHHLEVSVDGPPPLPLRLPQRDFIASFDSPDFSSFIKREAPAVVVCDTAYFFTDGDENSANDWKQKVVKPLKAISRELGTVFLLTHHYSKPSELRTGKHRTRGTSAILGDCDVVMRLEATSKHGRTLFVDKVKDAQEVPDMALHFDKSSATFSREDGPAVVPLEAKKAELEAERAAKARAAS